MARPDEALTERRAAILRAIVGHYVRTGEPAGSQTIVQRYRLGISPATVRNDMAALEDAGYIYQPHTSAGRIPTDAGYRSFVDATATSSRLPASDAERVHRFFVEPRWELEDALRQTASLLSSLTDHAAVVFAPALDRSLIRHVELVRLAGDRAMLLIVTDTGRVENHVVLVDAAIGEEGLVRSGEAMNAVLSGVALQDAAERLKAALGEVSDDVRKVVGNIGSLLEGALTDHAEERVYLEGASNIVDERKFADLETVRQVIGALEHRRLLLEMLADALATGSVSVRIGSENPSAEMQRCSVVTAPYGTEGATRGSLGIVGPTRMDYRRTIAAVYEVSSHLGRMLAGLGT